MDFCIYHTHTFQAHAQPEITDTGDLIFSFSYAVLSDAIQLGILMDPTTTPPHHHTPLLWWPVLHKGISGFKPQHVQG